MTSKPADRGRRSAGAGAGAARECQGPASPGIVGRRGVLERFSRRTAVRQKTDFLKRIKLIWPVQFRFAKIFRFAAGPNQIYIPRRPVPQRGVGHRHERWGGMRWTRAALKTRALTRGRRRRVVTTARRRRQACETKRRRR